MGSDHVILAYKKKDETNGSTSANPLLVQELASESREFILLKINGVALCLILNQNNQPITEGSICLLVSYLMEINQDLSNFHK